MAQLLLKIMDVEFQLIFIQFLKRVLLKLFTLNFMLVVSSTMKTMPIPEPTSLVPQEAAAAGIDYNTLCQTIVDDAIGGANA